MLSPSTHAIVSTSCEPCSSAVNGLMTLSCTDQASLPGILAVKRVSGVPTAFPASEVAAADNLLQVVYDNGPVKVCSALIVADAIGY